MYFFDKCMEVSYGYGDFQNGSEDTNYVNTYGLRFFCLSACFIA